jgi:hypothetical protein
MADARAGGRRPDGAQGARRSGRRSQPASPMRATCGFCGMSAASPISAASAMPNMPSLLGRIFGFLHDGGRVPDDWLARQVRRIDRTDGDIDTLSKRLAYIRTWTYVAQRTGWVEDESHWRGATRAVEDRLSDALHGALTQRFVDRRTSVLLRRLKQKESLVAEVTESGEVTVEGQVLGRIDGFRFRQDETASPDEAKTLRQAAMAALQARVPPACRPALQRARHRLRDDRGGRAPVGRAGGRAAGRGARGAEAHGGGLRRGGCGRRGDPQGAAPVAAFRRPQDRRAVRAASGHGSATRRSPGWRAAWPSGWSRATASCRAPRSPMTSRRWTRTRGGCCASMACASGSSRSSCRSC